MEFCYGKYGQENIPFKSFKFNVELGMQVEKGLRPTIPSTCRPEWAQLMEQCWYHEPASRPSFLQILTFIQTNFE